MTNQSENQSAEAVIEIYGSSTSFAGPVLLGTFKCKIRTNSGASYQTQSGQSTAIQESDIPANLNWSTNTLKPFGTVDITHGNQLQIVSYSRSKDSQRMLRNRGGKRFEKVTISPDYNRGGYSFAAANKKDAALFGKAGIADSQHILHVQIRFNKTGMSYPIYLLYPKNPHPKNPRQDWVYEKHRIELSFTLKMGTESWESKGPTVTSPCYEFINDFGLTVPELKIALISEYGNPTRHPPLHARDYLYCVDGSSKISTKFAEHLYAAVEFVNNKIGNDKGYTINVVEVACTFLTEGAYEGLQNGIKADTKPEDLEFDGYHELGIDSYLSGWDVNEGRIREFTSSSLLGIINEGLNAGWNMNEADQTWKTFKTLGLEDSVYAIACLYADRKDVFARDIGDDKVMGAWTCRADDLPAHLQFFWSTLYFNTGKMNGTGTLRRRGLEYHDLVWNQIDDYLAYDRKEKYNANWRTATFRLLDSEETDL